MSHPVRLPPTEAYTLWSADYDQTPNALLTLEERCLAGLLGDARGKCVIDVACGTGRWLQRLVASGAKAIGVDLTRAMLKQAVSKPNLAGRCVEADATRLPFADRSAHVLLSSFLLGYVPHPQPLFEELARVNRPDGRVFVTEIHPEALCSGWRRTFRYGDQIYEPEHHPHTIDDITQAAEQTTGLELENLTHYHFDEPERTIFEKAGRDDFDEIRKTPAIWIGIWRRVR